jgi:hypothetical protein
MGREPMLQEDDLFERLEAGHPFEKWDKDGKLLAAISFTPRRTEDEEDYWRNGLFESEYLPAKKWYFDSRKRDYPDFFLAWEQYVEAAKAARAEIRAGHAEPPAPLEPAAPATVSEIQQEINQRRGIDIDYWQGADER